MKKIYFSLFFVLAAFLLYAQIPAGFNYQAVIRNNSGELVKNKTIGMRITILQGTATGTAVYTETVTPATNINGLATFEIGKGNLAAFSAINWANGPYFLKTETDVNGGISYTITGTNQLLSVPYAMYAAKAGNGVAATLVSTLEAGNIKTTTAACGGTVFISTSDVTAYGVCWAVTQNPTIANSKTTDGTGLGNFTSNITGLTPGTTYFARAYATTSTGTTYGNQVTFKTFLTVVFPTVTTSVVNNITENSAVSGGNVTATGGAEVTAKGICWGTNQNPTIADNKTNDGNEVGQFASQMRNLVPGTTYYMRAYASNSSGTGYGSQVDFTTLKTIPSIVTKNVTSISPMGGVSGGTITITGGGTISDKGICWGESENPSINDNKISAGKEIEAFNSAISMLKPNTTCYVRAYAVNEIGIAYGTQKTFTTSDAFYDGFETGFSGTTGGWGIITGNAIEGAYSLNTIIAESEASLTRTLNNSGQISFYAKLASGLCKIDFFIDDVKQGTYSNPFWGLLSFPVTAGKHTFKWKTGGPWYENQNVWIDFIVMPK